MDAQEQKRIKPRGLCRAEATTFIGVFVEFAGVWAQTGLPLV